METDYLHVVDLSEVWNDNTDPDMLVPGFVVRGYHHIGFGPKESGKTMLVLALIVKPVLEAGETVIWIDKEMDRKAILRRLKQLGISRKAVRDHFKYLELPMLDNSKGARSAWAEFIDTERPALVVVDAQAGVLAGAGLNENETPHVLVWDSWYMEPVRRLGGATFMIDHTGHDEATRSRGASGKGALAKVELQFDKRKSFGPNEVGSVAVIRRKNTLGADIPEKRAYEVGGTPLVVRESKNVHVNFADDADSAQYAAVVSFMVENPGPHTLKELEEGAGVSRATLYRIKQQLAVSHALVEGKRDGARRGSKQTTWELRQ